MKTYNILSFHSVHVDDYEQGELEHVQDYEVKAEVTADTAKEAIQKYIESVLYMRFEPETLYIDKSEDVIHYDAIVDNDNHDITESDREQWKKGEFKAYSNRFELQIYEVVKIDLNEEF